MNSRPLPIDVALSVWLKGSDLTAITASLALHHKMGYADALVGLKRLDFYRFEIAVPGEPEETVSRLQGVLDRQSTFYNRNKHQFSLVCAYDGPAGRKTVEEGISRDDLQSRWVASLADSLHGNRLEESSGKGPSEKVTLDATFSYLVEVMVEDDDTSAQSTVAEKLQAGLAGPEPGEPVQVECRNRATLWWLALRAADEGGARELARRITVTTRRDAGLLMNPNYQRAEFVSVLPL